MYNNELYHHGVKGQKWGVRRYQNPDGSLTDAGRKQQRYRRRTKRWYNTAEAVEKIYASMAQDEKDKLTYYSIRLVVLDICCWKPFTHYRVQSSFVTI